MYQFLVRRVVPLFPVTHITPKIIAVENRRVIVVVASTVAATDGSGFGERNGLLAMILELSKDVEDLMPDWKDKSNNSQTAIPWYTQASSVSQKENITTSAMNTLHQVAELQVPTVTNNQTSISVPVNSHKMTTRAAAALGYEDSKELFSMGRIHSEWLNRSSTKGGNRTSEFDEESEADLFEIVLDNSGRSPNRVL
ncbi:hypothetical protein LWI29_002392 [Acer saccharum]|uniref:Uncharacterized protein n=1 Tax=Acer saccharum TaxID=4024 RepID=A0AA39UZ83_ACESA|nr:hypothetical protein LWI29_002392 [Acer saccharum]